MKRARSLPILSLLLWLTPFAAHAQSSGATIKAASCQQTDVNAVINGPTHKAVNGDTIQIPPGSCTWSSGITISGVGIDITGTGTPNTGGGTFGAGTANTTLTETGSSPFFAFTGLTPGQTAKVELLTFSTTTTSQTIKGGVTALGICTTSSPYCPSIRVDNITYTTGEWGRALAGAMVTVDNVFGVVDHTTSNEASCPACFLVDISFDAWQGVGANGDNSFASPDTFGTNQALYIENNISSHIRLTENDVSPGGVGGARYVCRFNELTDMSGDGLCGAHGTAWGGRFRGMRQVEAYYNTVSGSSCDALDGILSGTGYYLSNSYTGSGCNEMISVDIARFIQNGAPWNSCNGTQAWDQVPFSSTSACLDQPGRGAGAGLENATPVPVSAPSTPCTTAGQCWPNPTLDPIYEAGEVSPNNAPGVTVSSDGSSTRLLANRDYYAQVSDVAQTSATSPFNGTSGTGYGTLALRPTTCTAGVGYWATDQGTWNQGGAGGVLYVCSSGGNAWAVKYTPYTYPHPLTAGGAPSSETPNPPTALTALPQ